MTEVELDVFEVVDSPLEGSGSGYVSGYGSEYSGGSSDSGTEFVPRALKKEKGLSPSLEEVEGARSGRRKRATSGLRIHTSRALLPSIYSPKSQSMLSASCLAALAILGGALAVLFCGFFAYVVDHSPSSCSSLSSFFFFSIVSFRWRCVPSCPSSCHSSLAVTLLLLNLMSFLTLC